MKSSKLEETVGNKGLLMRVAKFYYNFLQSFNIVKWFIRFWQGNNVASDAVLLTVNRLILEQMHHPSSTTSRG